MRSTPHDLKVGLTRTITSTTNPIHSMPQPDQPRRETRVLVEASEIFQALYPTALASLLFVMEDERYKQADIADRIGCADSTISKARQSLKNLPLPLLEKRGHQYSITDEGKKVIGIIDEIADRRDVELYSTNWRDEAEKAEVAELLTPLSDSRSTVPIFILDSLAERGGNGELLGTSFSVSIEKIVRDVDMRQKERGESVTTEQVRQTLRRFDDADAISLNGSDCRLIEKGQEHAWFLDELVQLLKERRKTEFDESTSKAATSPETQHTSVSAHTDSVSTGDKTNEPATIANQIMTRGFWGGRSSIHTSETPNAGAPETPSIIPAYCLLPRNDESRDGVQESPSQFQAVLPMAQVTITELIEQAEHLACEYGDETQLASYWTLRTESGLYPLGPAELALDDVSHQAWTLINDLWNDDTRDAPSSNSKQNNSINE